MKRLLLVLLLTSCASPDTVIVKWHKVDDPDTFCRAIAPANKTYIPGGKFLGCKWSESGICHIAAKDFTKITEMKEAAILGHELKHCFDGEWHK